MSIRLALTCRRGSFACMMGSFDTWGTAEVAVYHWIETISIK